MDVKTLVRTVDNAAMSLDGYNYWRPSDIKKYFNFFFSTKSNINSFNRFLKGKINFKTLWTGVQTHRTHFLSNKFNARLTEILYQRRDATRNVHTFSYHTRKLLLLL